MAYIAKHPNSSFWTAVYRDHNGVWKRKTTKQTGKGRARKVADMFERAEQIAREGQLTENVCREMLSELLKQITGQELRQPTLGDFIKSWLAGKGAAKQPGTVARYSGSMERFVKLLDKRADLPIGAITPTDCKQLFDQLAALGLAPATLRCEKATLVNLFSQAVKEGLIATNPAKVIELPPRIERGQVKRLTFTPEQVQLLLNAAEPEWTTAILLGYYAGLRMSDAVTLEWSSVDFAGNRLVIDVHKTGDTIEVPLHPTLQAHLSALAKDEVGPICPKLAAVHRLSRSDPSKAFISLMRQAGISNEAVQTAGKKKLSRLSFHALRTSFNSALFNQGVGRELRMRLTGHKTESVNERYTVAELAPLADAVNRLPALKVEPQQPTP
jgi:integrase